MWLTRIDHLANLGRHVIGEPLGRFAKEVRSVGPVQGKMLLIARNETCGSRPVWMTSGVAAAAVVVVFRLALPGGPFQRQLLLGILASHHMAADKTAVVGRCFACRIGRDKLKRFWCYTRATDAILSIPNADASRGGLRTCACSRLLHSPTGGLCGHDELRSHSSDHGRPVFTWNWSCGAYCSYLSYSQADLSGDELTRSAGTSRRRGECERNAINVSFG